MPATNRRRPISTNVTHGEREAAIEVIDGHAVHEGGDPWIVVGEVIAIHRSEVHKVPLVFYGGGYVSLKET